METDEVIVIDDSDSEQPQASQSPTSGIGSENPQQQPQQPKATMDDVEKMDTEEILDIKNNAT